MIVRVSALLCTAHRTLCCGGTSRAVLPFRSAREPFSQVRAMHSGAAPPTSGNGDNFSKIEEAIGALSTEPMVPKINPVVLVVSGPSGVGKDSLVLQLQKRRPDLHVVVTATSRAKRPGEVDGKDYHFVTRQRFESWIERDELLEYALVYGEYKGIPREEVEEALAKGRDVLLRLDVQGAATVRQLLPNVVSVFVVAASEAELVRRLVERKTESMQALIQRTGTIKQECERMHEFEYVVVNAAGRLEAAVQRLSAIVDAEKCRIGFRKPPTSDGPLPVGLSGGSVNRAKM